MERTWVPLSTNGRKLQVNNEEDESSNKKSLRWKPVGFSQHSESLISIQPEKWNQVFPIAKEVTLEISIDQPEIISEIKLEYDGAGFLQIECKLLAENGKKEENDYKILVPKTTLRAFNDQTGPSQRLTRAIKSSNFTKSISDKKLKILKFTLEQPFSSKCNIGFRNVEILSEKKSEKIVRNKISQTPSLNLTIEDIDDFEASPPPPPSKSRSSPQLSPKRATVPSPAISPAKKTLKLLNGTKIIIVNEINAAKYKTNGVAMGAVIENSLCALEIENKSSNQLTLVIGDFADKRTMKIARNEQVLVVKKDWLDDCLSQQKRLPITNYLWEPSSPVEDSTDIEYYSDVPEPNSPEFLPLPEVTIKRSPSPKKIKEKPVVQSYSLSEVLVLPDFFNNLHIGLAEDIPSTELRLLERYIAAYGGCAYRDWEFNPLITHLLTSKSPPWISDLRMKIDSHPSAGLIIVQPNWIFDSHNSQTLLMENDYLWIED